MTGTEKATNEILRISTHTLTWSVTRSSAVIVSRPLPISTHTLTWSVTVGRNDVHSVCENFNSHAHVERDTHFTALALYYTNFNSHAHVERDTLKWESELPAIISTHTLTWSVTLFMRFWWAEIDISTHTLTWSVTSYTVTECPEFEISTHTLTWSVTGQSDIIAAFSGFQLTRSRGA